VIIALTLQLKTNAINNDIRDY